MESDEQHYRHIYLFYYRNGKNDVQHRKKLIDVYGKDVLTVRRFAKFPLKAGWNQRSAMNRVLATHKYSCNFEYE